METCCELLALRQEAYEAAATKFTSLDSYQTALQAGVFGPEPLKSLEEQHQYIESLPIPHVLLQHRNDHQGQVPARVPVPAPTSVRDPMSALMNVAAERSLAVGTPTPSEGDSGRATPPLSEIGSASEVGLEA